MKVIFVIGMANAGKSTYIKEHLSEFHKVDLYDYQENIKTFADIWKSYEDVKDEVIEQLKTHDTVVFEHTLLKAERRAYYIEAFKEAYPDVELEVILCHPDLNTFKRNARNRHGVPLNDTRLENIYEDALSILEKPTESEGFTKVTEISNNKL